MRYLFLSLLALLFANYGETVVGQDKLVIEGAQVKLIRNVRVPVREPGILIKLNVKVGEMVEAGQVLAQIDDELFTLQRQVSELELRHAALSSTNDVNKRFAKASKEVSSAVVRRSEEAISRYENSISKTELEKLELEAERDGLAAEQADLELRLAKIQEELKSKELGVSELKLAYRTILAPFNGMVVEMNNPPQPQEGEWLNAGDTLLRIIDLEKLHVEAKVDARKYDASLLGKKIRFTATLPPGIEEQTFEGVIDFVSPEIEPLNKLITIQAEIANRMNILRPGTEGTLTIMLKGD